MKIADLLSSNPRRNPWGYAVLSVLVAYVALLAAPGFLFAESTHFGAITVYSHTARPSLAVDIARAEAALARSPLDDPSIAQRIVLTGSNFEFAAFAPASAHAFGVTYPVIASTFLSPADSAKDTIKANRSDFNARPLSAVIAHERMHILLEHRFGALRLAATPSWKQEGYCDYIAGGASIPDDATGIALLRSAYRDPAEAYFRDTLRVRYLIEQRHLTVDQLFQQTFDTAELDQQALAAYRR